MHALITIALLSLVVSSSPVVADASQSPAWASYKYLIDANLPFEVVDYTVAFTHPDANDTSHLRMTSTFRIAPSSPFNIIESISAFVAAGLVHSNEHGEKVVQDDFIVQTDPLQLRLTSTNAMRLSCLNRFETGKVFSIKTGSGVTSSGTHEACQWIRLDAVGSDERFAFADDASCVPAE